jgi:hypothetical protein
MLTPSIEALSASFALRRCVVCGSADVAAICPGSDAEYIDRIIVSANGSTRHRQVCTKRAIKDVNLCIADAAKRWGRKRRRRA